MTKQDYRRIYAPLLDESNQRIEASLAFSMREGPADLDEAAFRAAVKLTQDRAARNLPALTDFRVTA